MSGMILEAQPRPTQRSAASVGLGLGTDRRSSRLDEAAGLCPGRGGRAASALVLCLLLAPILPCFGLQEPEKPEEPLPEVPAPSALRRPPIHEVLRYDCSSELATRSLVLFDDRMVRLKRTVEGKEEEMGDDELILHELTPDEYQAFLNRLEGEKPPEAGDLSTHGPGGAWVETCRLALELPGREPEEYRFRRFDALSLALSRRVRIAEEMAELAEEVARLSGLPPDYEGRPGDVLERRDGALFEIVRDTGDHVGWELRGIDQPLTVLIPKGALRQEFTRLVSRRPR